MYLILLGVGLLVAAAGFITIGFGIPINAFSLGNTLIIAGTVAVVGGLLMVGLAAAIRSVQRLTEELARGALPRMPARSGDGGDLPYVASNAQLAPGSARPAAPMPLPPRPVEAVVPRPADLARPSEPQPRTPEPPGPGRGPDFFGRGTEPKPPMPPEPRFAPPPPPPPQQGENRGPLDWLKPRNKARQGEPSMMDIPNEAPLSPRPPMRSQATPLPAEPSAESRSWSPRPEPAPQPAPRAEEPPAKDPATFDVVWPARSAGGSGEGRREPSMDQPRREPPPAVTAAPPLAPRGRDEPRNETPIAPAPGPAILKSGVIDGMAYTLYADGSIEAELPQGTIKFASIDALRTHLEKQS